MVIKYVLLKQEHKEKTKLLYVHQFFTMDKSFSTQVLKQNKNEVLDILRVEVHEIIQYVIFITNNSNEIMKYDIVIANNSNT